MRIEVDNHSIEKALEEIATKEMQKIATDLYAGLIRVSPVDTGRLRNGWQLELGDKECVVENNVEYTGWVMEDGTRHISAKHLITGEIQRVTKR
jgi:hypothetical protein